MSEYGTACHENGQIELFGELRPVSKSLKRELRNGFAAILWGISSIAP